MRKNILSSLIKFFATSPAQHFLVYDVKVTLISKFPRFCHLVNKSLPFMKDAFWSFNRRCSSIIIKAAEKSEQHCTMLNWFAVRNFTNELYLTCLQMQSNIYVEIRKQEWMMWIDSLIKLKANWISFSSFLIQLKVL